MTTLASLTGGGLANNYGLTTPKKKVVTTPWQNLTNMQNYSNPVSPQYKSPTLGASIGATSSTSKPKTPTQQGQFKNNQVYNSSGNYSKTNMAKALGMSSSELGRKAAQGGFKNSAAYYEYVMKQRSAPKASRQVLNFANGILNGIPTTGVANAQSTPYTGTGAKVAPGNMGLTALAQIFNKRAVPGASSFLGLNLPDIGVSEMTTNNPNGNYQQQLGIGSGLNLSPQALSGYSALQQKAGSMGLTPLAYAQQLLSSTGGGAGAGAGTGAVPGALGALAPTAAAAPDTTGLLDTQAALTQDQIDALIAQYNQLVANLGIQGEGLTGQYNNMTSGLQNNAGDLLTQIESAKQNSLTGAETNKQSIYETANTTQRANRNVLRSLGILGSSAAGDILSRPLVAADKASAQNQNTLTQRLNDLENSKFQVNQDLAQKKSELDNNYLTMYNQIQSDMRFGEQDKINAVQQLQDAYKANAESIQQWAINTQNTIQQQQTSNKLALAQILAYSNNTDLSGILGSAFKV